MRQIATMILFVLIGVTGCDRPTKFVISSTEVGGGYEHIVSAVGKRTDRAEAREFLYREFPNHEVVGVDYAGNAIIFITKKK